ncbi:hypothetical protein TELCIR_08404 [Teladorsagia circumcincta]|uniref:PPM-type phosphatase domain-containing protein n=1 Tax=Teladorsagia circumcincta TaxID=45464 RepID=A0A2G9UHQ1_TELCI|nr:hypothetical protein TELCIR_08404 [Teladorsagia circumcincta]
MGAFLDKPKTAKTNSSGEGNGLRYAMASMQGWRVDMEDAHVVEVFQQGQAQNDTLGSYAYCYPIIERLKVTEELKSNGGVLCEKSIILLEDGIKAGFLKLDENIRTRLDSDRSGSTAVCAMITPTHIIIANLGDSRAVVSRKDEGSFGTEDHKVLFCGY